MKGEGWKRLRRALGFSALLAGIGAGVSFGLGAAGGG